MHYYSSAAIVVVAAYILKDSIIVFKMPILIEFFLNVIPSGVVALVVLFLLFLLFLLMF